MRHETSCSIAGCITRGLAAMTVLAAIGCPPDHAVADEQSVADGQRIWSQKAQCPQCHGWAGDGNGGLHSAGLAASLRATQLTRDQIRETIQCGRPGTPMPHFDRFAYTDKRCYDMTAEDLGDNVPERAAATLQLYEIDALADYIATKIKGAARLHATNALNSSKPMREPGAQLIPANEPLSTGDLHKEWPAGNAGHSNLIQ